MRRSRSEASGVPTISSQGRGLQQLRQGGRTWTIAVARRCYPLVSVPVFLVVALIVSAAVILTVIGLTLAAVLRLPITIAKTLVLRAPRSINPR